MINLQLTQDQLDALMARLERQYNMSANEGLLVEQVMLKIRMGKYSKVPPRSGVVLNEAQERFKQEWHSTFSGRSITRIAYDPATGMIK